MRLEFSKDTCAIYSHGEHTMDSHKVNYGTYLSTAQKLNLEMVTRVKPQERPCVIRRGTKHLADELRVGPEHARGAANLCRKIRREMVDDTLQSPHSTGPKATFFILLRTNVFTSFFPSIRNVASNSTKLFVSVINLSTALFMSGCRHAACSAMSFELLRVVGTLRTWAMALSIYAIIKSTPLLPT